MSTLRTLGTLSLAMLGLNLVACDRTDSRPVPQSDRSGVTNMQPKVDTATVDRIATARCNREQSCDKIGAGQTYATPAVCMEQMRGSIGNDLNSYSCPRGLDQTAVDGCLAAIATDECNHPLDSLERVDKCRTSALCAK